MRALIINRLRQSFESCTTTYLRRPFRINKQLEAIEKLYILYQRVNNRIAEIQRTLGRHATVFNNEVLRFADALEKVNEIIDQPSL